MPFGAIRFLSFSGTQHNSEIMFLHFTSRFSLSKNVAKNHHETFWLSLEIEKSKFGAIRFFAIRGNLAFPKMKFGSPSDLERLSITFYHSITAEMQKSN